MNMNTTLRTRLMVAIAGTIVIILCATEYGLFVILRRQIYAEFDQNLDARTRSLAVMIEQQGEAILIPFQDFSMQEYARSMRPDYYQAWLEDGTVLARSRRLNEFNFPQLAGHMADPVVRSVTLPDGRAGRAAGIKFLPRIAGESLQLPPVPSKPDWDDDNENLDTIDFSGRVPVTLVVARDTLDIESSLSSLAWLLVASGTTATVSILAILAWLVTRSLRPLQTLARQIGDISEQCLSQRFQLADAPGELQPVVSRLNDLMNRLESAFSREKTFTADVAHELRTPLAGIRTLLEVGLRRHRDADSYRVFMEKCLRISSDTETIISTLLSLSRIEAGQATIENDLVDICGLLQRSWSPFIQRAVDRSVTIDWQCDQKALLYTDGDKLQVVLSNLLDNATRYVDAGGEILISAMRLGDRVEITVSNTGCELTADQVTHVFDRFWRADSARSETGIHAGLGLALSTRVVQFLGGEMRASVLDGRFVAVVSLPTSGMMFTEEDDDAASSTPAQNMPLSHSILTSR